MVDLARHPYIYPPVPVSTVSQVAHFALQMSTNRSPPFPEPSKSTGTAHPTQYAWSAADTPEQQSIVPAQGHTTYPPQGTNFHFHFFYLLIPAIFSRSELQRHCYAILERISASPICTKSLVPHRARSSSPQSSHPNASGSPRASHRLRPSAYDAAEGRDHAHHDA